MGEGLSRRTEWQRQREPGVGRSLANSKNETVHGGDLDDAMKLKYRWGPRHAAPKNFSFI